MRAGVHTVISVDSQTYVILWGEKKVKYVGVYTIDVKLNVKFMGIQLWAMGIEDSVC